MFSFLLSYPAHRDLFGTVYPNHYIILCKFKIKFNNKIVHFRNPQVPCTEFDFKLSGETVKTVDRYKYLGILSYEYMIL